MEINLTWDLFIIVFFLIILAYSFVIGKNQTMKIIVEPSAAVPFAATLERKVSLTGRRVGIILTGGNVDLDALPWGKQKGKSEHWPPSPPRH